MKEMSRLEATFWNHWKIAMLRADQEEFNDPEREHLFYKQKKKEWRFDFAWPTLRVAVECEGGTASPGNWHGKSRHTSTKGFNKDLVKYNTATAAGWAVFRFDSIQLKVDAMGCVDQVLQSLERSKKGIDFE